MSWVYETKTARHSNNALIAPVVASQPFRCGKWGRCRIFYVNDERQFFFLLATSSAVAIAVFPFTLVVSLTDESASRVTR